MACLTAATWTAGGAAVAAELHKEAVAAELHKEGSEWDLAAAADEPERSG